MTVMTDLIKIRITLFGLNSFNSLLKIVSNKNLTPKQGINLGISQSDSNDKFFSTPIELDKQIYREELLGFNISNKSRYVLDYENVIDFHKALTSFSIKES